MILLDTNVVSSLMGGTETHSVLRWLDTVDDIVEISVLVEHEIRFGIERLRDEGQRNRLTLLFNRVLNDFFGGTAFPVDHRGAQLGAELRAKRHHIDGKDIGPVDSILAAQTIQYSHTLLATRNVKDFEHLDARLINPWDTNTWDIKA